MGIGLEAFSTRGALDDRGLAAGSRCCFESVPDAQAGRARYPESPNAEEMVTNVDPKSPVRRTLADSLETKMILLYWQEVGGTLVTEYPLTKGGTLSGRRRADAVILPGGPRERRRPRQVSIQDEDVIVVQAKSSRLGMYLMGQAVFSAELVRRLGPRSVHSVAICTADDEELHSLLAGYPEVEVLVMPLESLTSSS